MRTYRSNEDCQALEEGDMNILIFDEGKGKRGKGHTEGGIGLLFDAGESEKR